jgi:hypothetical protein
MAVSVTRFAQCLAISLCASFLSGCSAGEKRNAAQNSQPIAGGQREVTREQLAATIPVGTPADAAKAAMEQQGFSCTYSAAGQDGPRLWCVRQDLVTPPVERKWQVVICLRDGRTTDISVYSGLIGP